jgi:hypothetical protein
MKALLQVIVIALCLVPLTNAQNVYMMTTPTSGTAYPNVQAAVTAAGTTGWVVIPSTYQSAPSITTFSITSNVVTFTAANTLQAGQGVVISGLSVGTYLNGWNLIVLSTGLSSTQFEAAFTHANVGSTSDSGHASCCSDPWTNPKNIRVVDERPFNPSNATTIPGSNVPTTTIKAAEYGALCNGNHDDTVAINAATAALVTLNGGGLQSSPAGQATVELPQGTCIIRAPIVLSGYGSLVGSSNGTYLDAADSFTCNSYGCDMVQVTFPYTGITASIQTTINRVVKDINFQYEASTTAITGVHIFNQTGNINNTPYAPSYSAALDQLPGVIVSDNSFFAMDTGVRVDDCGECHVDRNQFSFLRVGIWENGNDYSFYASENSFETGNASYTPSPTATAGFFASGRNAYVCSNSSPNCSTGTVTTTPLYPQGCTLTSNSMAGWDNDVNIPNCQGIGLLGNGFDYGADGYQSGTTNSTVLLGQGVLISQITNNFIANNNCNGAGLEIKAPTSAVGSGPTYNDFLINDNYFWNYCSGTPSASAIVFDSGSNVRRGVRILDNTFYNQGYGVLVQHGLQYSVIRGNYGVDFSVSGALINLDAGSPGSTSFIGTTVSENTTSSSVLAVYENAGGGYIVEYNQSPSQWTGTQTVSASGCSITAGAIGNSCLTTLMFPTTLQPADTSYHVTGCSITGASVGPDAIGDIVSPSTTSFEVRSIAMSATANGGGTIACTVTR